MTEEECGALELFAGRRGVAFESIKTHSGYFVFLGCDCRVFDDYGSALRFLFPNIQVSELWRFHQIVDCRDSGSTPISKAVIADGGSGSELVRGDAENANG